MQLNIILLSVLVIVVADSVPDEAVGTCSLQAGEILPDSPCYDNCKDTSDQRHFLTCIENACYCRQAGSGHGPIHPQQAAVPLNAGAVQETAQNVTGSSTVGPEASSGNLTVVSTESVSPSGNDASNGTASVAPVTPAGTNQTESVTPGASGATTAQVTPKP